MLIKAIVSIITTSIINKQKIRARVLKEYLIIVNPKINLNLKKP